MELEEAIEILKEFKKTGYHTLMVKYNWDRIKANTMIEIAIETVLNQLDVLKFKYQARKDRTDTIIKKQEKRISDLEFALMDMVLQFADESKDSINTMGLSALETAFSELDFNNPMPIKKVHEQYKKLAKKYFEKKVEESE